MSIVTYYKRYRMEARLAALPAVPALPAGFAWVAWDDTALATHAEVKYRCFRGELDASVFPNLSNRDGCLQLMRAIRGKPGFCPQATWLVAGPDGPCATVQGLGDLNSGVGAIQNLGVVHECRGLGLGGALLLQALHGFRAVGLRRAVLEVTARNTQAVRLYHRLGFATVKTLYREAVTPSEELYLI